MAGYDKEVYLQQAWRDRTVPSAWLPVGRPTDSGLKQKHGENSGVFLATAPIQTIFKGNVTAMGK